MSWGRFDSFVEQFELRPKSWLSWARVNDVEVYREAFRTGQVKRGKPRVETFEWGQAESLLAAIFMLMQQQVHVTAQKGAKHPKRFRGKSWTAVSTAFDRVEREYRAEATRAFEDMFVRVPQEEFDAEVAAHNAAMDAGDEQTALTLARSRHSEIAHDGRGVPEEVAQPFHN